MTFYFAYGTNMDISAMRARCPGAQILGPARLDGWHFCIGRDGYATIARRPGGAVHGLIWRLSPRDLAVLDAYESIGSGLYRRRWLSVRHGGGRRRMLVYLGRNGGPVMPRPGHLPQILDAARNAGLPTHYRAELSRWRPGSITPRPRHSGSLR